VNISCDTTTQWVVLIRYAPSAARQPGALASPPQVSKNFDRHIERCQYGIYVRHAMQFAPFLWARRSFRLNAVIEGERYQLRCIGRRFRQ
jgi:hypothetical protein